LLATLWRRCSRHSRFCKLLVTRLVDKRPGFERVKLPRRCGSL